jgi:hypothetical protein
MAKARMTSQISIRKNIIRGITKGKDSINYMGYKIKKEVELAPRTYIYSVVNFGTKAIGFKTVRQAANFIETL